MPRRSHVAVVAIVASMATAPLRGATADEYGRRIDAVSAAQPGTVNAPARSIPRFQPVSKQQGDQELDNRRELRQSKRQESATSSGSLRARISRIAGGKTISTVFAALAIVLGAFLLLSWFFRRGMPKGAGRLPGEVVEVLGRMPLASKQTAQLVRLGNKLLLISLTTNGAETLAEVTDANEVARIVGLCESTKKGSASIAFRQVFEDLADERPKFVT